jgi:hypothetical protein
MIKPFLILNLMLISTVLFPQERFYYLYDGWEVNKVFVDNTGFILNGLCLSPTTEGYLPQYNKINHQGGLLDSYFYANDSIDGVSVYRSRSYLFNNNITTFTCALVDYSKSYSLAAAVMSYDNENKEILTIKSFYPILGYSVGYIMDTSESGFVIVAVNNYNEKNSFPNIIFLDQNLNVTNTKRYEFLPLNSIRRRVFPYQLLKLPDGGYILSCEDEIGQFTSWPDQQRAWFLRLDSEGNELWRRTTAGVDTLCYRPFAFPTQNNDYIITWSDPYLSTAHNLNRTLWLANMTDNGVIYGKRKISDDIEGFPNKKFYVNDYYQDATGNIYIMGEIVYPQNGFLIKINPEGHAVWFREYECFPENDAEVAWTKLYGLTPTPDGGFIMGGEYMSPNSAMFPGGIQKGLAIKVDSCGCLVENCNPLCNVSIGHQFITSEKISIYPNPSTDLVNLELNTFAKNINIQVFDAEGCLWINTVENSELNNPAKHSLDISGLAAGSYVVNIWAEGKLFRGKFVKIF